MRGRPSGADKKWNHVEISYKKKGRKNEIFISGRFDHGCGKRGL